LIDNTSNTHTHARTQQLSYLACWMFGHLPLTIKINISPTQGRHRNDKPSNLETIKRKSTYSKLTVNRSN